MINWQGTTISQYNQSPTLMTLLYAINQWFDPRKNIDDFYNFIWNVATAKGYGLDVWGRIVGVGRVLNVQAQPWFGFAEATVASAWPFDTTITTPPPAAQAGGIFYDGGALTSNYPLSDDGFRVLIMAKAAFNIIDGSIPAINQLLANLFPDRAANNQRPAWVVDNRNMSMTYVFNFIPTAVEAAIISQSGVLPRPTGVSVSYTFLPAP